MKVSHGLHLTLWIWCKFDKKVCGDCYLRILPWWQRQPGRRCGPSTCWQIGSVPLTPRSWGSLFSHTHTHRHSTDQTRTNTQFCIPLRKGTRRRNRPPPLTTVYLYSPRSRPGPWRWTSGCHRSPGTHPGGSGWSRPQSTGPSLGLHAHTGTGLGSEASHRQHLLSSEHCTCATSTRLFSVPEYDVEWSVLLAILDCL